MKKSLFLVPLCLLVALVIPSCGEDGEDPQNSLVGTWRLTSVDYTGTTSSAAGDISYTGTGEDLDLTMVFTEDPNEVTVQGDYSILLETEFLGQTVSFTLTNQDFVSTGTWSLNGSTLTVTSQGQTSDLNVVDLNTADMTVTAVLSQNIGGNQIDVTITYGFARG